MMKKLGILSVVIWGSIASIAHADPIYTSPVTPYLALEKEIIYHPDQLIKDVDKRWKNLGYGYYTDKRIINNPSQPSRIETRLQIQALCLDLKDLLAKKGNVSLSDEDIEKTWIKEGPIAFLSSLYYIILYWFSISRISWAILFIYRNARNNVYLLYNKKGKSKENDINFANFYTTISNN